MTFLKFSTAKTQKKGTSLIMKILKPPINNYKDILKFFHNLFALIVHCIKTQNFQLNRLLSNPKPIKLNVHTNDHTNLFKIYQREHHTGLSIIMIQILIQSKLMMKLCNILEFFFVLFQISQT